MDWTVVRHKRGSAGRPSRLSPACSKPSATQDLLPLAPVEAVRVEWKSDADEEERLLLGNMKRAVTKVEQSVFFRKFEKQMQDLEVVENLNGCRETKSGFQREVGEVGVSEESGKGSSDDAENGNEQQPRDPTVELVVYGVGSISDSKISRCQLALALLLKQRVPAIGNVLVFDPIMSPLERRVMVNLGCSPLEDNDQGRRPLNGPTLFYMPHCEVELYESVLQANLTPLTVNQMVILGNSFRIYQERWSVHPLPHGERPLCLLKVQASVEEIPIADNFSPIAAFNDTNWHFFSKVEV